MAALLDRSSTRLGIPSSTSWRGAQVGLHGGGAAIPAKAHATREQKKQLHEIAPCNQFSVKTCIRMELKNGSNYPLEEAAFWGAHEADADGAREVGEAEE